MPPIARSRRRSTIGGRPPRKDRDPCQKTADAQEKRLAEVLDDDALAEALQGLDAEQITGPGGLLTQLAGRVINAALAVEMTEHLGRPHGESSIDGNYRNGSIPKTLANRAR